jgi:hypothetical protein
MGCLLCYHWAYAGHRPCWKSAVIHFDDRVKTYAGMIVAGKATLHNIPLWDIYGLCEYYAD